MKVINIVEIVVILIIASTLTYEKMNDDSTFTLICPIGLLFAFMLLLALLCDLCPESIIAIRKLLFSEI